MHFPVLTTEEIYRCAGRLPRVDLAHLPTPLEEVPRFAERIGGCRILIKRDDCTGLLFGGNKTRHNEFLLADALHSGADMIVWGAGIQSNNCRQTAAACAKLGLECHLYLTRKTHNEDIQGNLLLDYLAGAHVHIVDAEMGQEMEELLRARAAEFRAAGHKPYVWDRSRGQPFAAVSYTVCMAEIVDQLKEHGLKPAAIYVAAAGPTGAGVALGKAMLGLNCPVRLICPIKWGYDVCADMADVATHAAVLLDLPHRLKASDIEASEEFIGAGYGKLTPAGWEAMDLLARTEGILLDPVYTAKAMAGLIHDVRTQRVAPGATIVFIHTGGQAAIFAYRDEVLEFMRPH